MSNMAEASGPPPVKLICGMISAEQLVLDEVADALAAGFGPIDLTSEPVPFDFTHYYDESMGRPLWRQFVSFAGLIPAEAIIDAKVRTNAIEAEFAARPSSVVRRPINLDPGYIEASKLVLASMKDFSHRIYLGRGVYAEVTLMHRKRRWEPLAWTFPDFASGRYDAFLTEAQDLLRTAGKEKA